MQFLELSIGQCPRRLCDNKREQPQHFHGVILVVVRELSRQNEFAKEAERARCGGQKVILDENLNLFLAIPVS